MWGKTGCGVRNKNNRTNTQMTGQRTTHNAQSYPQVRLALTCDTCILK